MKTKESRAWFHLFGLPWLMVSAVIVWSMLSPASAMIAAPWFFFGSLFLLGMPHGFIDAVLLLDPRLSGELWGRKPQWQVLATYGLIAAGYGAAWWFFPAFGMASFLLLTAWHWGSAEAGESKNAGWPWYVLSCSKGGIIIFSIFAFHFEEALRVVRHFELSVSEAACRFSLAASACFYLAALCATNDGSLRKSAVAIGEAAAVILLFAVSPLFLGLSVYYAFFHSYRQYLWFPSPVGKGISHDGRKTPRLLLKTHLFGLICVLPVILICLLVTKQQAHSLAEASIPYHLQVLAVLTLPHTLLVAFIQKGATSWIVPISIPTGKVVAQ